jgi:site-specific DNA recombinase
VASIEKSRQSPTSISDQIRKCRDYAARQPSWLVLDQHIYSDEAVSGTSTEREGLQKLLAAAGAAGRPFDCILIDDTSRLTRKLADALNLYERLTFAGVRLVAVSQGVDSESSQAELLIGVHGLIDAVYWRELGQKTHRGMQGLALRGFHTGGRCFGYRSLKLEDGSARLEIDQAAAEIINRIYRLYAESGYSMKRIAHTLNAEGVDAPQPQKGRFGRSWCVSSVRHILLNSRYTGKTTWIRAARFAYPEQASEC